MDNDATTRPIRFFKRKLVWLLIVAAVIGALLFVPYPTQVSPSLKLQVVDQRGKGFSNLPITWRGGFYAYFFEETATLNNAGQIELPARSVRMSLWSRISAMLESLSPHSGGFRDYAAQIYFALPEGFEFDPSCVTEAPTFDSGNGPQPRMRIWNLPDKVWKVVFQERMAQKDYILLNRDDPNYPGTSSYRLVLRPKPIEPTEKPKERRTN